METSELLKRVRQIEIKTKGLSRNIFAGEYHSAFKGRGMAFAEVREYQYGDDIRDIEWNVTARFNKPFIKVFEEERELTVMLLVDVSGSHNFGTSRQMTREMVAEIAATLAFSAIQNNDKIGVIFFSDRIEKFIPPQKGRKHILYIISILILLGLSAIVFVQSISNFTLLDHLEDVMNPRNLSMTLIFGAALFISLFLLIGNLLSKLSAKNQ